MCKGFCRLSYKASALISFVFIMFTGKQFWQEEKEHMRHFAFGLYITSILVGMEETGDTSSTSTISSSRLLLMKKINQ